MEHERRQWHLDKTVSISHVVTTIVLLVAAVGWAINNEGRLRDIESESAYHGQRLIRVEATQITQAEWIATKMEQIRKEQREDTIRLTTAIQEGFVRIESKMDRKADK